MTCSRFCTSRSAMVAAAIILVQSSLAQACNVPVFRYALERWAPFPYEVTIFHEGELSEPHKKLAKALLDYRDRDEGCPTNFALEVADVANPKLEPHLQRLYKKQKASALPWLVIRYPEKTGIETALYEGPLDGVDLKKFFDSPVRGEVAKRLLAGHSAVWLLIESGDKKKDDEKYAFLQDHLAKLQKELKLPELADSPADKLQSEVKLKLEFSVMRLEKNDKAEAELVKILLHMEDDLDTLPGPLVFPIIGRGMALPPLAGAGITEENVHVVARFIVGPCSCEVKALNPGVDILMTAAWEDGLQGRLTKTPELPPLTSLVPETPAAEPAPKLSCCFPSSATALASGGSYGLWRNIVIVLGAGFVALLVLSMFIFGRKA